MIPTKSCTVTWSHHKTEEQLLAFKEAYTPFRDMLKSEDKTNNVYIRTGEFSFLREFRDMAAVQEWQDWINTYVSLNPGFPTATFETADI